MNGRTKRRLRFVPLGEQAVIVKCGETFEPETHARAARLAEKLAAAPFPGFRECVPSYVSVCVYFDLFEAASQAGPCSAYEWVCERIERLESEVTGAGAPDGTGEGGTRDVTIPVCYCPACGPDLADIAEMGGLSVEDAASLHAAADYAVAMIGFLPGFPYLAGLPDALRVPRLDAPRIRVPAGSVAVAGGMACVYPSDSPGGWRLIGRTPIRLFDPLADPPSALAVGDRVRFIAVPHDAIEEGLAP